MAECAALTALGLRYIIDEIWKEVQLCQPRAFVNEMYGGNMQKTGLRKGTETHQILW